MMESDIPSASWHPALMPNSNAETFVSRSHAELVRELKPEPILEDEHQPELEATTNDEISIEAAPVEATNNESSVEQSTFDVEEGAWDISNTEAGVAEESTLAQDATADDDAEIPEHVPSANSAKHSSTISFTRTIPHEVSWNDDEDAEWDLHRTETDPFKFMPPNERTNSFPPVPPIESTYEEPSGHPAPAMQAHEFLDEDEHTDAQAATGAIDLGNHIDNKEEAQYVGGETVGAEEEASDARYEEGLPLIPSTEQNDGHVAQTSQHSGFGDAFADEAGEEGDDFFSQIQSTSKPGADRLEPQTLQRKDTSMFVNAAASHSPLSNTFEPETPVINEEEDVTHVDDQEVLNGGAAAGANPNEVDAEAKWAAVFTEDDDFLLEDSTAEQNELDPTDLFGSDDEGFLEDTPDDTVPEPAPAAPSVPIQQSSAVNGRYAPSGLTFQSQPQPTSTAYNTPPVSYPPQQSFPYAPPGSAPPQTSPNGTPPPAKPELPKTQSFVTKAKGGYQSPYDLPMDLAPKKRVSLRQLQQPNHASTGAPSSPLAGPPRNMAISTQPPPSGASVSSPSPPLSSHSSQQGPTGQKPTPQLKPKAGFFEELPMSSKVRPASRQNSGQSHSSLQNPYAQPPKPPQGPLRTLSYASPPVQPAMQPPTATSSMQPPSQPSVPAVASLVAPERVSPYAALQSNTQPKPSAPPSTRYSPAPVQAPSNGVPPSSSMSNRYSPAPSPMFPHQPRTSSPLAHFETSRERLQNSLPSPNNVDGGPLTRSMSSHYEPRANKKPSLPPTREVAEDGAPLMSPPAGPAVSAESRYSPRQATHTPPPLSSMPTAASTLSPPKRSTSNYAPMAHATGPTSFVPPPRSQTQSPGALYGARTNPIPRPSSAHGPRSPRAVTNPAQSVPNVTRTRGISQHLNLVAPTDGRENDPLQRWKGAPLISWGVGGNIVTTFPKDIPRYGGVNQALPTITRSPGEVKVRHVKDIQPLEERLAKFPGPLKGKSKKKETIAWLTTGIETLEASLPNVGFLQFVSHEDKRAMERVLLWKILRVFVEFDGVLEGNANVEKSVRQILTPEIDGANSESALAATNLSVSPSAVTSMQSDAADSTVVEQMRSHLLAGDREKAVWAAVDKRLWGHAMLISNTVPGDLYKKVAQEFIRKEVNHAGYNNESLAALYGVLSGNFEESVDELVPVHARAGLQLMSTSASAAESKDALAGLDKWRETLGLILSNRSVDDIRALSSLGNLLSGYGRAEAAHICFLFARQHAIFDGLDDPNANFVLLGADHRRQANQFAKETEALLLSEVYEYGLSLAGGLNSSQGCPHLAAYKLQHAMTLAEYGFRDKALQYCEAIMGAITSQTKRSPYYHPALESSVDDLMKRLKLAPKEESSSWIPKPTMNQVSNTMWNRFNKFVAGEDNENSASGTPAEGAAESGPFARIAGGTPTISPSPSVNNFEVYGNAGPAHGVGASVTSSRYAPGSGQLSTSPYAPSSTYAPRSSLEQQRTSTEMSRGSFEPPRSSGQDSIYGGYQPTAAAASQTSPYAPVSQASAPIPIPYQSSGNLYTPYEPYAAHSSSQSYDPPAAEMKPADTVESAANSGYQPHSYGYEPPSMNSFEAPSSQPEESGAGVGYEAPSYQPSAFEPPSYQPGPGNDDNLDDDIPKPKKKSFMDDDDDDIPGLKKAQEKSKSDKDRENEEMFRRVAEEEAKRAAEAKAAPKKGWFSGWLGGGSKKEAASTEMPSNKAIKAKLGEESSFVYDPELKRWVNKKPGAENTPAKTATPPPPRAASRNGSATPPPPGSSSAPPAASPLARPPPTATRSASNLSHMASSDSLAPPGPALGGPPAMIRSASNMSTVSSGSGPPREVPSRPATSLSNASSIDDLLGAPGAGGRKAGGKKPRRSGRYVDVMAK